MQADDFINALGMTGEEALRVLYFANKHMLTVDVACQAIWEAREMVEYEIQPPDAQGQPQRDIDAVVPYHRDGRVLLAVYVDPWLSDGVKALAIGQSKTL